MPMPSHASTTDEALHGLLRPRRSSDSHDASALHTSLGMEPESSEEEEKGEEFELMDRAQAYTLYACHFLSTWNARTYEFAAVLFTASAYPAGFTASSLIGITGSLSAVLFAPSLGQWVDRAPSRLRALLTTIAVNRCAVLAACACWLFIVSSGEDVAPAGAVPDPPPTTQGSWWKPLIFTFILILGTAEKLSRIANVLSIERDWVPTLAPPSRETATPEPFGLTRVNAVMGRIDLLCKLGAPVVVSGVVTGVGSMEWGVCVVAGMGVGSWGAEVWTTRRVWRGCGALRRGKVGVVRSRPPVDDRKRGGQLLLSFYLNRGVRVLRAWARDQIRGFRAYFATTVWAPSIAISILHVSSLSYTATLIVYLLGIGFGLNAIMVAKTGAAVAGLGSTWVLTWGVRMLAGKRLSEGGRERGEEVRGAEVELLSLGEEEGQVGGRSEKSAGNSELETGVIRLGAWSFGGMVLCLTPVVLSIWTLPTATSTTSPLQTHPLPSLLLLFFLSLSSLTRELLPLATTQLSQTRVPPTQWSSFAGSEMSFVSLFGLGHWVSAVWFWRIEDFQWLAVGSWAATAVATGLYGWWMVREMREKGGRNPGDDREEEGRWLGRGSLDE